MPTTRTQAQAEALRGSVPATGRSTQAADIHPTSHQGSAAADGRRSPPSFADANEGARDSNGNDGAFTEAGAAPRAYTAPRPASTEPPGFMPEPNRLGRNLFGYVVYTAGRCRASPRAESVLESRLCTGATNPLRLLLSIVHLGHRPRSTSCSWRSVVVSS
jgi:hypothetical protein